MANDTILTFKGTHGVELSVRASDIKSMTELEEGHGFPRRDVIRYGGDKSFIAACPPDEPTPREVWLEASKTNAQRSAEMMADETTGTLLKK